MSITKGYQDTVSSPIVINKNKNQQHKRGGINSNKTINTEKFYSLGFAYLTGFMVHVLQI
jgi:hypothetical protein